MAVAVSALELDRLHLELKAGEAAIDRRRREIVALASTPNEDLQGDVVLPSAFRRSLRERQPSEVGVY